MSSESVSLWKGAVPFSEYERCISPDLRSDYSLVNARGSYSVKQVRVDFGIENLFDKFHCLPIGGTYTGQGTIMSINGIPPGMGRSIYVGVNVKFSIAVAQRSAAVPGAGRSRP